MSSGLPLFWRCSILPAELGQKLRFSAPKTMKTCTGHNKGDYGVLFDAANSLRIVGSRERFGLPSGQLGAMQESGVRSGARVRAQAALSTNNAARNPQWLEWKV